MVYLFAVEHTSSLSFDCTIQVGDIIALLSLIAAIAGGVFAFIKWNNSKAIKRAEYIDELTARIRSDEDIVFALSQIEYDMFTYNGAFHGSGKNEQQFDKTLSYFSYICYLKKHGILSPEEFRFFDYEVTRIFHNVGVVNYLYNLYHFSRKFKRPLSFYYLVEYGIDNNLLHEDFTDKNSWKRKDLPYTHVLNF